MRLLDITDLNFLGIKCSYTKLWRMMKAGDFPKPVAAPGKKSQWAEKDVFAYLDKISSQPRLRSKSKVSPTDTSS